jgi:UDP-N-acetylmuramoyl-tripeptide--D-alanyl-D-alanine ligase
MQPSLLFRGSFVLVAAACAFFLARRLLRYLRYFQQEDYDQRRFFSWLAHNRAFDRRGTGALLATAILGALSGNREWVQEAANAAAALCLVLIAAREGDARKSGKIKLKMTSRATRIWVGAVLAALLSLLAVLFWFLQHPGRSTVFRLGIAALVQITPLYLLLSNAALLPAERRRQGAFRQDAEARLRGVAPFVVGITGSYGKTSTKAILGELLQAKGPTLWPPGSINTPMGITRYVRENLRPHHRYAVFELAAYRIGSIRALCDLVHPAAGIITNIGIMHLGRFGGEESVFKAKSELVQALPKDGILVLNADDKYAQRLAALHAGGPTLYFGLYGRPGVDCFAEDITFSLEGTRFSLFWGGEKYLAQTGLLGRPALSNVLAAFTMAAKLGAEPDYLLARIRNLQPQSNRLALAKRDGGVHYLNDAYNSNPVGFRAALEVLAALPAARRILMTPGMIDLGSRQEDENFAVALEAGRICDMVLIVGEENARSLAAGVRGAPHPAEVRSFATSREAFAYLHGITVAGDVILIENDLPDLYERPAF